MTGRLAGLALLAVLSAPHSAAAEQPFAVGSPPSWVERLGAGQSVSAPAAEVAGGVYYRLLDRQLRVTESGEEAYQHVVREIVNEVGLESTSQLKVEFDPSYQSVTLHGVRVRRAGRVLERLDPAQVSVLQREPDLEAQKYDGTLSLVLFVEDLRVGDVVDHAFTVRGLNPVYDGRFHGSFGVEWSIPVQRSRLRLLFPASRPIFTRSHGTSLGPVARRAGAWRELVLGSADSMGVPGDPLTPADHVTWGWVQLTEWSSWREVAQWGARLFSFPDHPPAALQGQVERWRSLDPAGGVHAALRFVQDEVRYLGIELGSSSHRPHAPDVVAARRFGDCKDKVLLFCTLARSLGAGCTPALVSTTEGRALDDWLPSPGAFDHVVARVQVGGKTYWTDPTLAAQGGVAGGSHFPDYRRALLLAPDVDDLSVIPVHAPQGPGRVVHERFFAKDTRKPADFSVETRFVGREADGIRFDLRRSSREEIGRRWLDYYAKVWPKIRSVAPVVVEDDREANALVTRERYAIPDFWTPVEGAPDRRQAGLSALALVPYLRKPPTTPRTAPVRLDYPVFVRHVMEVALPDELDLEPNSYDWATPELRFHYRSDWQNGTLVAEYELETRRDRVTVVRLPTYFKTVEALATYLEWHFEHPRARRRPLGGGPNWPVLAIAGLIGVLGLAGSALVFLRSRPDSPPSTRIRIVASAAVLGATCLLATGLARLLPLYSSTAWIAATTVGHEQYRAAWAPVLLAALAARILLLAACLLLLALLATSRRFRGLLAAALLATVILCFAEGISYALLAGARSPYAHGAGRDALIALGALFLALPTALSIPRRDPRR